MVEFGKRELQLMQALWANGPQTAREIREGLPDDPADATVRTMLRILENKGCVTHVKKGRAFVYRATVPVKRTMRSRIRWLIENFFGGSAEALVAHLVDEKDVTPDELEAILESSRGPRAGK